MIEHYSFGRIRIDGVDYIRDVIIFPDRVDASWWRKEGHGLVPEDLESILAAKPDVVIIGTGAYGAMTVPEITATFIRDQGIELHVLPTGKAVELFNELSGSRRTVAGLHLTC